LNNSEAKQFRENQRTNPTLPLQKNIILTKQVNPEIYTAWKDNLLVFENESFESIALKLERRYGASIVFTDNEIKNYIFSGKFPEISIDRALKALQYASPFNYSIKNDSIYIQK
jgi:ferric-dicitrate binding protein FerR (iron transport regulator)